MSEDLEQALNEVRRLRFQCEDKDAEIERLRTQCGGNCRYWEGRWRDEAAEIERLLAMLDWIEIYDPVQIAAAELKFGNRRRSPAQP